MKEDNVVFFLFDLKQHQRAKFHSPHMSHLLVQVAHRVIPSGIHEVACASGKIGIEWTANVPPTFRAGVIETLSKTNFKELATRTPAIMEDFIAAHAKKFGKQQEQNNQ